MTYTPYPPHPFIFLLTRQKNVSWIVLVFLMGKRSKKWKSFPHDRATRNYIVQTTTQKTASEHRENRKRGKSFSFYHAWCLALVSSCSLKVFHFGGWTNPSLFRPECAAWGVEIAERRWRTPFMEWHWLAVSLNRASNWFSIFAFLHRRANSRNKC